MFGNKWDLYCISHSSLSFSFFSFLFFCFHSFAFLPPTPERPTPGKYAGSCKNSQKKEEKKKTHAAEKAKTQESSRNLRSSGPDAGDFGKQLWTSPLVPFFFLRGDVRKSVPSVSHGDANQQAALVLPFQHQTTSEPFRGRGAL